MLRLSIAVVAFLFSIKAFSTEYKLRVHVTNAEKMKAVWLCKNGDGTFRTIDKDNYPASVQTTHNTTISDCASDDVRIAFEILKNSNWRRLKPGAHVCSGSDRCGFTRNGGITYNEFATLSDFNSEGMMCSTSANIAWTAIYVGKRGC